MKISSDIETIIRLALKLQELKPNATFDACVTVVKQTIKGLEDED